MRQPPPDVDTVFEDLLQDLPPETVQMAREFQAFTRARKVKTPVQLLRLVLLYCGLDKSLREVAGHFTLLVERITDSAVAERLAACRPWVRALLARLLPAPAALSRHRRQWHSSPGRPRDAIPAAPVYGSGDLDVCLHHDYG